MRQFIKRAIKKSDKLNPAQFREILVSSAREIDRLEAVIDSLPRGILVCDINHNLILANKSARKFLSIVSYEQSRESIWSVIGDERVAEFLAFTLVSADKAEECEFELEVLGLQRILSVSVIPLVEDRQVSGTLILVDDITERRNREAQMQRMEKLASLTTLAAGIAHEIKNPLGSISIHVQLLQKTIEANRKFCSEIILKNKMCEKGQSECLLHIDKYLAVVNEEVDRLNSIVVDFLFAVRPMNAKPRRGSLNALVQELAEFVSFELQETNIKCVLNLAENLSALDFDAGLMKQAILNLIKNAMDAMGSGGILGITTEEADGTARLIVSDTGMGISEDTISKIFEPYFTTKDNGTGLGLTLVYKIVKEHQGDIAVKSREGKGSVFTITLPIPQASRRLIAYEAQTEAK